MYEMYVWYISINLNTRGHLRISIWHSIDGFQVRPMGADRPISQALVHAGSRCDIYYVKSQFHMGYMYEMYVWYISMDLITYGHLRILILA